MKCIEHELEFNIADKKANVFFGDFKLTITFNNGVCEIIKRNFDYENLRFIYHSSEKRLNLRSACSWANSLPISDFSIETLVNFFFYFAKEFN